MTLNAFGVSVHWLQKGFQHELKRHGKNEKSTIRSLEDIRLEDNGMIRLKGANITCPRDCDFGAAYVDCLVGADNVGSASILLLHSHNWSNTVGDIVKTLSDHCTSKNLDPKRCYVWIDFLCTNLHRVAISKQNGKWNASEEFQKSVLNVKEICANGNVEVLVVMGAWKQPLVLNNLWNVYEIYLYMNGEDDEAIDIKFGMSQEERTSMIQSAVYDPDALMDFTQLFNSIDVEKMDNVQDDVAERNAILSMIKSDAGSKEINLFAKDWISNCLVDEICSGFASTVVSEEEIDGLCSQLGPTFMQDGSFNQAFRLFQKSLSIREKGVDADGNPSNPVKVASVMQNIGLVLQNMDELDESLTYLKKALLLREKKLGIYTCETSDSYNSVGDVYFALGAFDQAMEMYKVSLAIEEKLHGMNNSRTATAFNNLGKIYGIMGNLDQAMFYLQQALATREEILGADSPDVAASYNCIAAAFSRSGDHDEAVMNYKKALAIHEIINGGGVETAAVLNNIAMTYCDLEEYKESLPYFERAIQIYKEVEGEDHPHTKVATKSYHEVKALLCENDV